ncbi:acetyltransferase (GNAT) family protein [Scopulibacillus darangshiensis]|uniref:Acetyltransferase (GNAT) family protein n=1 Tax=Scopulibacillus darangshiensis TaxID=442528 RepID=A0A4R2NDC9_9BACL|nr:GNAT family N-acetyltransferase [Scopulibacillus darangshiensis]TCP19150.1 acetyltransferase (GNAT) family protein [Scopulibacillus darangshiensis]
MGGKFRFTNRVERIFNISKSLVSGEVICPVHFLVGAFKERTGVCAELFLYLDRQFGIDFIDQMLRNSSYEASPSLADVLELAHETMVAYHQIYINEGHIIRAILELDPFVNSVLDDRIRLDILNIVSVPRDMIVSLKKYMRPEMNQIDFSIRKALPRDYHQLLAFVKCEFGDRWVPLIENGYKTLNKTPIFLAIAEDNIIGFACYDVVRNRKGLFGPMGTAAGCRTKGIGAALLHFCLNDMAKVGYEYAIIGQAGPIEFYEKTCGARIIPVEI